MESEKSAFIHKKAVIEGSVDLGEKCSVWACAVIRGDEGKIKIGKNSSVQECCVVHGKTRVGENVTVGHGAIVHGCSIGNNVLVGMNSTILTNASIGDWVIIGAGSVIREGQKIPKNSLVAGVPAKVKRKLTKKDKERIKTATQEYLNRLK